MIGSRKLVGLSLGLSFLAGCGGSTPEVDNAVTIPKEAAKPTEPASSPAAPAASSPTDAPKG